MILFEITSHETSMHVLDSNYNVSSSLHVSLGFNSHMLNAIHADVICCYWNSNAYLIRSKKLNRQSHSHRSLSFWPHYPSSWCGLCHYRFSLMLFAKFSPFCHLFALPHTRTHTNTCLPNNNSVSLFWTRR